MAKRILFWCSAVVLALLALVFPWLWFAVAFLLLMRYGRQLRPDRRGLVIGFFFTLVAGAIAWIVIASVMHDEHDPNVQVQRKKVEAEAIVQQSRREEASEDPKIAIEKMNASLNSGNYSDTSKMHWSYNKDDTFEFFNIDFADGRFCGAVDHQMSESFYGVVDPMDPKAGSLLSGPPPHKFVGLDYARSYLWQQCEAKLIARAIYRSTLEPGEIPQD